MKRFRRLLFATVLASPAVATLALSAPVWAQAPRYELGISISANDYGARCWANMVKGDARIWRPGTSDNGPKDADGNPTTDCDIFVFDGGFAQNNSRMGSIRGTYRLYFTGQADVTGSGGVIQNKQYNAATNTTSAEFVVSTDYPSLSFQFRNTRRTTGSPLGSGLTDLKLMRPLTIGSTQSYAPDVVFTTEYLAAHNRGNVLRMMDFSATNGTIAANWSDRRRVGEMNYSDGQDLGYWWQGKGTPWEYTILLCNTLDKDLWVCIPPRATDDYVVQLARLIKNTLEPGRKVYFEYSNEIWNFSFPQFGQVQDLARADVQANPSSTINYDGQCWNSDGTFNGSVAVPRYWARRTLQMSDIFRSEFGDAAMMTRVRPLFETQAAWQHWISTGLLFLDRYYNNGDGNRVASPRPISAYLWGAGGSAYIHGYPESVKNDPSATTDSIIAGYDQAWVEHYNTMARDTFWSSAFGLKRVAYEAGPGLDDFAGPDSGIQTAQRDPRMKGIYRRVADEFFKAGGELFTTFLGVNTSHGLLPFDSVIANQPKPKQEAFDEMAAATARPAPTVGFAVPAVIPAGRYHVREDGYSTGSNDAAVSLSGGYAWIAHTVRVASVGEYTLALPGATGTANVRVEIDGRVAGTLAVPGTGTVSLGNLSAGVHGVRLVKTSGSTSVASLDIKAGTGGGGGPVIGTGTGLTGSYFANKTLTGTATGTRTDATVNFDWGSGTPGVSGIGADNFSVRWNGTVQAPVTGTYTFITTSDDGVRLSVNGTQIINNWTDHAPTDNSGTITLSAGQKYTVVMEYFESGGGAVARLNWAYPGQARQAVPQTQLYPVQQQSGVNLVTNPGYEVGNLNNWLNGGSVSMVTTGAYGGTNAGRANGGWSSLFQTVSGLKANTRYTLTVWAKASDSSGRAEVFARDFGGTAINRSVTSTGYTQVTITFTTGASNTSVTIGCGETSGSTTSVTVDDWSLTEG